MVNLTFGEQVKIILGRKGMTIKELAELVEQHTGKPMSRQNMTQRLGRDNFQEQDMRLIAEILGCKFQLSIMELETEEQVVKEQPMEIVAPKAPSEDELNPLERDITIGELVDMADELEASESVEVVEEEAVTEVAAEIVGEMDAEAMKEQPVQEMKATEKESEERTLLRKGIRGYFKKAAPVRVEPVKAEPANTGTVSANKEETPVIGDVNPYTGKEYKTNSVRMHPKRIGYVQVYDQEQHKWTDMTEWAFLGYQERKKALLGKDYEPPIYLD